MMSALFGNPAQSNGLDFEQLTSYEFDLSGIKVSIDLPGSLDARLRVQEGLHSANIYDISPYNSL
ncbi:MAG: hypothetical protein JKX92_07400 [Porticoccaceae bacterium]|nr:hypothetical protein [Porticoccaceae bacterium]